MKWNKKICWFIPFHKYEDMNKRGYVGTNFLNLLRAFKLKTAKGWDMSYGNTVWRDYQVCKRCGHIRVGNYTIS